VFGSRAEKMPAPSKGEPIMVVGTPEIDTYTGRDGQQRSKLKMTAREVEFLGSRAAEGDHHQPPAEPQGGADFGDDSIPF